MEENLTLKNGKWGKAVEEPYYPSVIEKIKHWFGFHVWTETRVKKCVICGLFKKA